MRLTSAQLKGILNLNYPIVFTDVKLLRQGGNASFSAVAGDEKYFVKVIGQAFADTFETSTQVNLFLQSKGFPVPEIINTGNDTAFVSSSEAYIIVYRYIESAEIDMERDAEEVGGLIGTLHKLMNSYDGGLNKRGKYFFIDRYVDILHKKQYSRADEFAAYGEMLWSRLKALPQRYSHGDLYTGNIVRESSGGLNILDFDTSCIGFAVYDLALICNATDYFNYDNDGFHKTKYLYERLLPQYLKLCPLTDSEINSVYDMLAVYHFSLQATIIEIYGFDCVDGAFFDIQLDWLRRWEEQSSKLF